ncbi:MAG: hypothetical protein IPO21_15600 [Bacteroidales bacterium]|nr:hypothetical protein [Bacteroidales bacterium]
MLQLYSSLGILSAVAAALQSAGHLSVFSKYIRCKHSGNVYGINIAIGILSSSLIMCRWLCVMGMYSVMPDFVAI